MDKSPAFQFYYKDFLVSTAEMTAEEVGGYIRLLCHQWDKGAIPDNNKKIAVLSGCYDSDTINTIKKKFTDVGQGLLKNPKLEEIRLKQIEYAQKKSIAGKKGMQSRYQNYSSVSNTSPNKTLSIKGDADEDINKDGVENLEHIEPEESFDQFDQYQQWTDLILNHQDQMFDPLLKNHCIEFSRDAITDHLAMLGRYPNMRPDSQQKFRTSLIAHMKKYLKPSASNGYQKTEAPVKPYVAPKRQVEESIMDKIKSPIVLDMSEPIEMDKKKLSANPKYQVQLGAIKFDHLQKTKVITPTAEMIDQYMQEARGERIRQINENMELQDNRMLNEKYKTGKEPESEKVEIKNIAKSLAYLNWLTEEINKSKPVAVETE